MAAPVSWPDDVRAAACDGAEYGHLVMPLGGIGTGNLAICADGGLRQWQLHNIGNHAGALECGDHYVRSLAGWSALQALAGFSYDSQAGVYTFRRPDAALPFLAGTGWGLWSQQEDQLVMACTGGRLELRRLRVVGGVGAYTGFADGTAVPTRSTEAGIEFPSGITLIGGQALVLAAR